MSERDEIVLVQDILQAVNRIDVYSAGPEQVVTGLNGLRRSDFCIAGRSRAKGVSGNTVEPCDEPAGKKRPAHAGCVLARARFVAALVRCPRIDLRAAPAGSLRENRNAN